MHYLVVDNRFVSPVYAFLEQNPAVDRDFPGLSVRSVTLETREGPAEKTQYSSGVAVGQNPSSSSDFCLFGSERAVHTAGFGVIEPKYVGASWASYTKVFPFGRKATKSG